MIVLTRHAPIDHTGRLSELNLDASKGSDAEFSRTGQGALDLYLANHNPDASANFHRC
jgi:hypothetical protein